MYWRLEGCWQVNQTLAVLGAARSRAQLLFPVDGHQQGREKQEIGEQCDDDRF